MPKVHAPKEPLTTVFMPARNEQETIGRNLDVIKRALERGKLNHAVVVVDGSADRTAAIVCEKLGLTGRAAEQITAPKIPRLVKLLPNGFVLVRHAEPQGKGTSFVQAVQALDKLTPHFKHDKSVLVNIDADALDLEVEKIIKLAQAVRKKNEPMVLGIHLEQGAPEDRVPEFASSNNTGFRAIAADALKPLLARDSVWVRTLPRNLALDAALNLLLFYKRSVPLADVELLHLRAGRHLSVIEQSREVRATLKRFEDGNFLKEKLRASLSDLSWTEPLAFREYVLKNLLKKKA